MPFSLGCKHQFCTHCWQEYLMEELQKGVDGIEASCMQAGCNCKVPHSVFLNMLEGKYVESAEINIKKGEPFTRKATELYWKWLCKSFTDENKLIKWCPELGCEFCVLLKAHATVTNPVVCECGAKFCIYCGKINHDPVTCEVSK